MQVPRAAIILPCDSTCEYVCVCELNMMKCFTVKGLLTATLSRESLLCDTGTARAVTPVMAG